jgi:nicotinate-nucleotide--dimethylbenzimidazole phosphoribosyltransferase
MQISEAAIWQKINNKTKPPGSLGMLEQVAAAVCSIQDTLTPTIWLPHIVVFAGDHGIAATGLVNPYPQSVTAQMVLNFVQGGAAINVFTRQQGIMLEVVDAGVNTDFDHALPIIHAKIKKGTDNYLNGPAMSIADAQAAMNEGKTIVQAIAAKGCNCIGFGEMGIGNSSAAALIMHHYTRLPLVDCVGRGTGVNDTQLAGKLQTLQQVAALHELGNNVTALEVLSRIGSFEIAMMAGAFLEAAAQGMVIIVDGFIATAALLIARSLQQEAGQDQLLQHCIFAHTSGEQGHEKMLQHLGAKPLLHLGLRLGEGTGAALAIPLVQTAVAMINEMASFESAGVDNKI